MPTVFFSSHPLRFGCVALVLAFFVVALFLQAQTALAAKNSSPNDPPARRIVSLGPINTENLFLIGAGGSLIGCTTYCNHPPEAKKKEKIGTVLQPDIEKIISLNPDLILATGLTSPEQVAQFTRLGIKVVHFRQPRSFAEICDNFLLMGKLTGHLPQAEQVVATARQRVEEIRLKVAALPKPTVFLEIGAKPLFASVGNAFTNDYLTFAGGINIAAGETRPQYDYERLLAHNPDVILIAIMGGETGAAGEERRRWLSYPVLAAAKNERVHMIDPDLVCSPTPVSFVRGLALVAELLHPGLRLPEAK
ncbi:MAG: ABC transporter substrate-binding protein [Desulfobulbaceae bacterium]|jgi:iron complex transport system substrate-binding protein|nr:ABC transporter substrate-binding protein [Desulfobulbaceae bacterium]